MAHDGKRDGERLLEPYPEGWDLTPRVRCLLKDLIAYVGPTIFKRASEQALADAQETQAETQEEKDPF